MIPLADQERIRQRFDAGLVSRIRVDLFTQKPSPIIIPGRPECPFCEDVQTLLTELAGLSSKISLTVHDFYADPRTAATMGVDAVPAIVFRGANNRPMRFFGMPTGAMFTPFIETLVETSAGNHPLQADTLRVIRKIRDDVLLQVLIAPACEHSPSVAQTAFRFAQHNVKVKTDVVEVKEFPTLIQRYGVTETPAVVINGTLALTGAIDEATLADCVLRAVEGKPITQGDARGPSTPLAPGRTEQEVRVAASGLIIPR